MTAADVTPDRRWLLVSDIDETLTGDAAGMALLGAAIAGNRGRLRFAVNSSRPSASVGRTLREVFPKTLAPEAVITALGTEISVGGVPLAAWHERFAEWPRDEIFATLLALGHRPHDDEFQTPAKASFAVIGNAAQAEARAELERLGLDCRIIASGMSDFDIIPAGAGKDAAALFLAESLGIGRDRIVAAGDSGNDLDLFKIAASAIAVGNAREELLAAMPALTSYHAEHSHARGVLEGLQHFGILA